MLSIVSGGQTGVDRAALDAAIEAGLSYRGWCPNGGWAEDSPQPPGILANYPNLKETPESAPGQRTDWNVRDSDALIVLAGHLGVSVSNGTERAIAQARKFGKPFVIVDVSQPNALERVRKFLQERPNAAVGIGGPRESEEPGIYAAARTLLDTAFADLGARR